MKKIKLLALLSVLISSTIYSDIKLDGSKIQNTTIEQGKKGNTIININTPNGKGISVNDFENFQTKNGVVFNNSGQRMNISQLEGIINGNPNITGDQAKLILNRVNGTNRTEIEGAMEAVGRNKVDMIFSSPNGIYLDGAKFIGFKDVTFTTAPVNLDGEGNIQTLTIDKGNIDVGRKGIDASKLEQLALLSKQISIDGSVKSKNIDIISGNFDYNVNDKSYVNKEVENKSISISSSEFGSIYGDQINVIATNGGVGLKGDIIAGEKIFIDGRGRVEIEGDLNTERDLYIIFKKPLKINGNLEAGNEIIISRYLGVYNGHPYYEGGEIFGNITTPNMLITLNEHVAYAPSIIFYGDAYINNQLTLKFNMTNRGNMYVNNILLKEGILVNHGNMLVLSDINYDKTIIRESMNKINNYGTLNILGNVEVNILDNNNYDIHNSEGEGLISIGGDLIVNLIYSKSGSIDVKGNIYSQNFRNHGIINVSELNIIYGDFQNFGLINSNNIYAISSYVMNKGIIKANEKIEIKLQARNGFEETNFFNYGKLESKNLKIDSVNLNNEGLLKSEQNMELKAEKLVHTGKIETDEIKLITKEMELDGYIKAKKVSFENYLE